MHLRQDRSGGRAAAIRAASAPARYAIFADCERPLPTGPACRFGTAPGPRKRDSDHDAQRDRMAPPQAGERAGGVAPLTALHAAEIGPIIPTRWSPKSSRADLQSLHTTEE